MSLDRTKRTELPEHDSKIKRAVDKVVRLRSWDRTAGIEQLGQDNQDKTAMTGQPGQESWDRKVRKTDRIRQTG